MRFYHDPLLYTGHTYEEEVEQLKGNRGELQSLCKELEKQLDVARTSETSLKEAIQSSQKVHKTVLASHEKIEQDWINFYLGQYDSILIYVREVQMP